MSDKILTESGLKILLEQLKNWLPFIKTQSGLKFNIPVNDEESNESIIFNINYNNDKCVFEIAKDGSIYILDSAGKKISLQQALSNGDISNMSGYNDIVIDNEDSNERAYDIEEKDTVKKAIKKLDKRSESKIIQKNTYLEFPTIGKRGIIYRDKQTGKQYIWDSEVFGYVQTTSDIIFGGGAEF